MFQLQLVHQRLYKIPFINKTKKGSQWGDEGKGKLVDILAEKYDVCARYNGGANAGKF